MQPLQATFGELCQWTKKVKDAVVYGWARQILQNRPKKKKIIKHIRQLRVDAHYAFKGKHTKTKRKHRGAQHG